MSPLRRLAAILAPFPVLARTGHAEAVSTCPLLGEERKSLPTFKMTAFDPSRTSAANFAVMQNTSLNSETW
jgi:hypothetical protein